MAERIVVVVAAQTKDKVACHPSTVFINDIEQWLDALEASRLIAGVFLLDGPWLMNC